MGMHLTLMAVGLHCLFIASLPRLDWVVREALKAKDAAYLLCAIQFELLQASPLLDLAMCLSDASAAVGRLGVVFEV
jgi:hypothetical protein